MCGRPTLGVWGEVSPSGLIQRPCLYFGVHDMQEGLGCPLPVPPSGKQSQLLLLTIRPAQHEVPCTSLTHLFWLGTCSGLRHFRWDPEEAQRCFLSLLRLLCSSVTQAQGWKNTNWSFSSLCWRNLLGSVPIHLRVHSRRMMSYPRAVRAFSCWRQWLISPLVRSQTTANRCEELVSGSLPAAIQAAVLQTKL